MRIERNHPRPPAARPGGRRHGMGLLEIMVAVTICALLLVACATAFTASATAINDNDAFFRCTQAGRVTLDQILAEIRDCKSLDMSTANTIKIIRTPKNASLTTQDYYAATNEVSRAFAYDAPNKRITLQITYTTSVSPVYELTKNVSACTFGPADMGFDQSQPPLSMPVHVPISITITTGNNSVLLTGSAVPRQSAAMRY